MQTIENRKLHFWAAIMIVVLNICLAFAFYVAEVQVQHSGMAKNKLSHIAEITFCIGLLAAVAASVLCRKTDAITGWVALTTLTMFNQMSLVTFLVSAMPFKLG